MWLTKASIERHLQKQLKQQLLRHSCVYVSNEQSAVRFVFYSHFVGAVSQLYKHQHKKNLLCDIKFLKALRFLLLRHRMSSEPTQQGSLPSTGGDVVLLHVDNITTLWYFTLWRSDRKDWYNHLRIIKMMHF